MNSHSSRNHFLPTSFDYNAILINALSVVKWHLYDFKGSNFSDAVDYKALKSFWEYLLQCFLKNEIRSLFFFFQPKKGSRYLYFEYI